MLPENTALAIETNSQPTNMTVSVSDIQRSSSSLAYSKYRAYVDKVLTGLTLFYLESSIFRYVYDYPLAFFSTHLTELINQNFFLYSPVGITMVALCTASATLLGIFLKPQHLDSIRAVISPFKNIPQSFEQIYQVLHHIAHFALGNLQVLIGSGIILGVIFAIAGYFYQNYITAFNNRDEEKLKRYRNKKIFLYLMAALSGPLNAPYRVKCFFFLLNVVCLINPFAIPAILALNAILTILFIAFSAIDGLRQEHQRQLSLANQTTMAPNLFFKFLDCLFRPFQDAVDQAKNGLKSYVLFNSELTQTDYAVVSAELNSEWTASTAIGLGIAALHIAILQLRNKLRNPKYLLQKLDLTRKPSNDSTDSSSFDPSAQSSISQDSQDNLNKLSKDNDHASDPSPDKGKLLRRNSSAEILPPSEFIPLLQLRHCNSCTALDNECQVNFPVSCENFKLVIN